MDTARYIGLAKKNHLDIVKLLVEKGAKLDLQNKDGKIPRDLAAAGPVQVFIKEAMQSSGSSRTAIPVNLVLGFTNHVFNAIDVMVTDPVQKNSLLVKLVSSTATSVLNRSIETTQDISWKDININYKEKLGAGGFGVVYAAKWGETRVAIKLATFYEPELFAAIPDEIQKEVSVLKAIHHDNIVQFYGMGLNEPDRQPFLVLEFLEKG